MRDQQIHEIAKGLGIDPSADYNFQRVLMLKLALENERLKGKLEAVSEYEGLLYDADQPIPYQLTEKAKAELDPVSAFEKSLEQAAAAGHGQIVEPANLEDLL